MKSSFLIVADRGNLKAFRVEEVPNNRPPRLNLVEALSFAEAHTKISEMNTDLAGRFPVGGAPQGPRGNGLRHQNSISDKHYEIETGRRLARTLADQISRILKQEHPQNWSFAAPSEIQRAILDELEPSLRSTLAETVNNDLVNATPSEVLDHFSVRAA